jgi:sulfur carrier protein ThiS
MQIRVKLMGMLKSLLPAGDRLDLVEGATIGEALTTLGIAGDRVAACSVNGKLVRARDYPLADGDELTVLPPVGGG